jgi:ATP adenylyltransferase
LDRLWAPWRIGYVLSEACDGCIFCEKPAADDDCGELILNRSEFSYVLMNAYPYNNGHLLVVPYEHVSGILSLSEEQLFDMMRLTRRAVGAIGEAMHPDGFNVGFNVGRIAGAGIEEHVHLHIVPRWAGDTNFMPVLGDTRVVPQSLRECYELLVRHFEEPS